MWRRLLDDDGLRVEKREETSKRQNVHVRSMLLPSHVEDQSEAFHVKRRKLLHFMSVATRVRASAG